MYICVCIMCVRDVCVCAYVCIFIYVYIMYVNKRACYVCKGCVCMRMFIFYFCSANIIMRAAKVCDVVVSYPCRSL